MVADPATAQVPEGLADLLTTDVLGHLVTVRADGSLAPAIVWFGHVSASEGRR